MLNYGQVEKTCKVDKQYTLLMEYQTRNHGRATLSDTSDMGRGMLQMALRSSFGKLVRRESSLFLSLPVSPTTHDDNTA
jgi:hypothetical protein